MLIVSDKLYSNIRNSICILICIFLLGCSSKSLTNKKSVEDANDVFEIFFKETLLLSYLEFCNEEDIKCEVRVKEHIINCFDILNFTIEQLSNISNSKILPKQNLIKNSDKNKITNTNIQKLDNCMTTKINGRFAHNIKNNFKQNNLIDPSINIKDTNFIVEINNKNEVLVNNTKVDIKNIKNLANKFSTLNPKTNAFIIGHQEAMVSVFTQVLDEIRSSNIENISLMTSEN